MKVLKLILSIFKVQIFQNLNRSKIADVKKFDKVTYEKKRFFLNGNGKYHKIGKKKDF